MTATPTTPAPETRRPRRWPKVLLAVSLTFNLLVLGVILGARMRDDHDWRRPPPPDHAVSREGGFAPFFDAMPGDARRQMLGAMRDRGGLGPDRAALAAEFRDLLAALRTEPFDPSALDAVLTAQHARVSERVAAGRAVLIDQVAAMSPADRAAFADSLENRFRDALSRAPRPPEGGANGH